jgi:hypothetical protein
MAIEAMISFQVEYANLPGSCVAPLKSSQPTTCAASTRERFSVASRKVGG